MSDRQSAGQLERTPSALAEETADGGLGLHITECRSCGLRTFPPERFGCQRCGATAPDLDHSSVPAVGRLVDSVLVHRHRGPGPEAPFAIADIDVAGLRIRALLTSPLPHGTEVCARLAAQTDGSEWVVFSETQDQR